jgi:hypothetical protein
MLRASTLIAIFVGVAVVAKCLLCLRPYVPAFSALEGKEGLFAMVGFVVFALYVAIAMFPAFRPFDTARVGPLPEYRGRRPRECW